MLYQKRIVGDVICLLPATSNLIPLGQIRGVRLEKLFSVHDSVSGAVVSTKRGTMGGWKHTCFTHGIGHTYKIE